MAASFVPRRGLQVLACATLCAFILGFFLDALGVWTGPILAAWLIGTQPPLRGAALLAAIGLAMTLISRAGAVAAGDVTEVLWEGAAVAAGAITLLLYRLSAGAGAVAILALPLWSVAAYAWARGHFPALAAHLAPGAPVFAASGPAAGVFAVHWFAATIVFMWQRMARPAYLLASLGLVLAFCWAFTRFGGAMPQDAALPCAAAGLLILIFGGVRGWRPARLTPEQAALLRNPCNGEALRLDGDRLVGAVSGQCFAIRNGIPRFVELQSLTGLNRKYNGLYETIGSFYDDFQRVYFGLCGIDRRAYFEQYLGLLEIRPNDRVLETSVGTGLNFYYLPRGLKLFGLDLSCEMLGGAQLFLARHGIAAALLQGNAEALPFADNSMDVVFHCGAINFFDDKAKAIAEMIRVARPGSRILIADETEKLAKKVYERAPVARGYFTERESEITTPVGLVPPDMQDIEVRLLRNDEFYALTFRKPATAEA